MKPEIYYIVNPLYYFWIWLSIINDSVISGYYTTFSKANMLYLIGPHSAPLAFSTKTKSSEEETSFGTFYDVKEVRISQEKHLSSGFPMSYQLNSAGRAALVGRSAGTG